VLRAPELDAELQVRSHQSGVEGNKELWRDVEKSKGILGAGGRGGIKSKASNFVRERSSLTMTVCPQTSVFPRYQVLIS